MHAPCSTLTLPVAIAPARPFGRRQHDGHRPRPVLAGAAGPRNQLKKAEQQLIFTLAVMAAATTPLSILPARRLVILHSGTASEARSLLMSWGLAVQGVNQALQELEGEITDGDVRSASRTARCVLSARGRNLRRSRRSGGRVSPGPSHARRSCRCLTASSAILQAHPPNKMNTPFAAAAAPAMRCGSARTSCGAASSSCGTARPRRGRPTGRRGPRGRRRWSRRMRCCARSCCRCRLQGQEGRGRESWRHVGTAVGVVPSLSALTCRRNSSPRAVA